MHSGVARLNDPAIYMSDIEQIAIHTLMSRSLGVLIDQKPHEMLFQRWSPYFM
jgi:hypothetical protein